MSNRNRELIPLFRELAELTVLDEGNPQSFRARAYDNAILEVESFRGDLSAMTVEQLCELEGIGKSTAQKIREYFDTGRIAKLEELRAKWPPSLVEISRIPGIGPKTLQTLRRELGVQNIDDLRRAIEAKALRTLPRMGEKTEQKIAQALARMDQTGKEQRTPIARAMPVALGIVAALERMPEVERAEYCGSLRRLRETIGDIDVVVASRQPGPVMQRFVELPMVRHVLGQGDTKASVVTDGGLQVDLRVVDPEQYGAALLYFTGSKAHNIKLRGLALRRGWTLNEYALSVIDTEEVIASRTEEEIYRALGLAFVPAPMREDTGEVEAAAAGALPAALRVEDLRGDLHVHSSYSGDGRSSLEEMVAAAAARGYAYLAITDHGEDLQLNGVSRQELLAQRAQLDRLRERHPDMTLLWGCELNIGPTGGLDYDEEFRMQLDWCVAAVHSHFDLDQAAQTRRIIKAMEDPSVHVIGHLSGRMIGKRPGIQLDVDAVLQAAVDTGTAIEINSGLPRLDAAADVLRRARELGVTLIVSTDAHHVDELERTRWGAQHAQRGWVERDRVANTWPRERFLAWAAERRQRRR